MNFETIEDCLSCKSPDELKVLPPNNLLELGVFIGDYLSDET